MKTGNSSLTIFRTFSPGSPGARDRKQQFGQDRRANMLGHHQRVSQIECRGLDRAAQEPQGISKK